MAQCEICGTDVVQGRGRARRTCSAACRQKAHRKRQARHLAELRAAGALALVPPAAPNSPAADDSPAGRIRAVGARLAELIDQAARRAADGWNSPEADDAESAQLQGRAEAARAALALTAYVQSVVVPTILASAPETSRDEPQPPPASTLTAASSAASRNEPAGAEGPVSVPGPSRDEPAVKKATRPARRKRLSQRAARAIADNSHLVRDERHEGWLLRDDETGTVLGHIEPSYGGTSVSGRNGWTYRVDGSFARTGPYRTRNNAAVQCALSWMRLATVPVHSTITGD